MTQITEQAKTFSEEEDLSPLLKSLKPVVTLSAASTDVSESESEMDQSPKRRRVNKKERYIRARDRVIFILHVINLIVSSALVNHDAKYFTYWSAFVLTISLVHRIYSFYVQKWHFYMVDFCYFANFVTIFYIVFAPQSELLFKGCFAFTNGVLMFSVGFYRNTFAFHSMDKMTSVLLHFNLGLSMFLMRWHDKSKIFYAATAGTEEFGFDFIYKWCLAMGLIYHGWAVVYYLIIFVFFKNYIKRKNLGTLFSQTLESKRLFKIINKYGEKWQGLMFMSLHWRLAMLLGVFTMALYYNYWLGLIWIVSMFLVSISNGASYYIDYHSSRYENQFYGKSE